MLAMRRPPSSHNSVPPFQTDSILCTPVGQQILLSAVSAIKQRETDELLILDMQQKTFVASSKQRICRDKIIESYLSGT